MHQPDPAVALVPAHLIVHSLGFSALCKLVMQDWFLGIGTVWLPIHLLLIGEFRPSLVFGYVIGAPL
jgi:hypothetical protein